MFAQLGLLDEVETALDRLYAQASNGASAVEVEAAVLGLERVKAKVAGLEATLCRSYEVGLEWKATGALRPAAVPAAANRIPSQACNRGFTLGRRLAELPAIHDALATGAITVVHLARILGVDNPRVHEAFVADHPLMVAWARELPWTTFCARLQWWRFEHDPDGKDPGVESRGLDLSQTWRDRWVLDGELDAVAGTIVATELKRLEQQLFEQDWRDASERLGRDPLLHELGRTPRQRRADALRWMAERSASGPEESRRGKYLFTVVLGPEAFLRTCQLANGIHLTPDQVAEYADDERAVVETVLLDAEMRTVTASKQRRFAGVLRRIALFLSGGCYHPFCDKPAEDCQADHVRPHSKGGPTALGNGQGGCPGHNRAKGARTPDDDP